MSGPTLYAGPVKVLVIGSGAREHAIVKALGADPDVDAVIVAPGNPGMDAVALCEALPGGLLDGAGIADLARSAHRRPGRDRPGGAARRRGRRRGARGRASPFGPSAQAAQLEGSKSFAKDVMAAADVPTALARVCSTLEEVGDALDALGAPHVVKDDGLAAGKGVVVTDDRDEALAHAQACLAKDGWHGRRRGVPRRTRGVAVLPVRRPHGRPPRPGPGLQAGRSTTTWAPTPAGMGAYSPLDWAPASMVDELVSRVAQPTVDEMARRGTPFVGVLYIGVALTSRGPRVIEFNARFGDPETQVVLARLQTPLGGLLQAAATGVLDGVGPLNWSDQHAVTVVVASHNYPGTPRTGDPDHRGRGRV